MKKPEKTFTPKDAPLTKKQIWDFFYDENVTYNGKIYCSVDGDFHDPVFLPEHIDDQICQKFVDEEFTLHGEYEHQEDEVQARNELVQKYYKRIIKAMRAQLKASPRKAPKKVTARKK